ncbi:MAG: GNAT family N-acetyltransferase [Erysipelotrichaceae bacterium]|nr:GNAT family N-acetyltransferase [Erysipelotrichaceae bacterium]
MIRFEKETLTKENIAELIRLSHCWAEEECSHGIVPNTKEDLKEPLYTARDEGKLIGYIFGHFYTAEKRTSYIEPGSRCFEVDEFYVLPEYRSRGIGRQLFSVIESEVMQNAEYLTLATSTKDYRKILRFYTETAGMDFHSAFLIKKAVR